MNDNNITKIITPPNYRALKPITVGEIPQVYLDSLTYAEQILELIKYIRDVVYPTLVNVINTTNENIELMNEALENFKTTLDSMITDIENFKATITNEWETYQTTVNNKLDEYEQLYHNFEMSITNQFTDFTNSMTTNFNNIQSEWNNLTEYLNTGTVEQLNTFVPDYWDLYQYDEEGNPIRTSTSFTPQEPLYVNFNNLEDNSISSSIFYFNKQNTEQYGNGRELANIDYNPYSEEGKKYSINLYIKSGYTGTYYIDIVNNTIQAPSVPDIPNYNEYANEWLKYMSIANGIYKIDYVGLYEAQRIAFSNSNIPKEDLTVIKWTGENMAYTTEYKGYKWFMGIIDQFIEVINTGKIDVTADFEPQFNELKQDISNLQTNINNVENQLTEHITNANNIQQNNQSMLNTHTEQIASINQTINEDFDPLIGEVASNSADITLLKNDFIIISTDITLNRTSSTGTINGQSINIPIAQGTFYIQNEIPYGYDVVTGWYRAKKDDGVLTPLVHSISSYHTEIGHRNTTTGIIDYLTNKPDLYIDRETINYNAGANINGGLTISDDSQNVGLNYKVYVLLKKVYSQTE